MLLQELGRSCEHLHLLFMIRDVQYCQDVRLMATLYLATASNHVRACQTHCPRDTQQTAVHVELSTIDITMAWYGLAHKQAWIQLMPAFILRT